MPPRYQGLRTPWCSLLPTGKHCSLLCMSPDNCRSRAQFLGAGEEGEVFPNENYNEIGNHGRVVKSTGFQMEQTWGYSSSSLCQVLNFKHVFVVVVVYRCFTHDGDNKSPLYASLQRKVLY